MKLPTKLAAVSLSLCFIGCGSIAVFAAFTVPMDPFWMWSAMGMALLHGCLGNICVSVENKYTTGKYGLLSLIEEKQ